MANSVSFRQQVHGTIAEFLEKEGISCAESNGGLTDLVGALASYREEGVRLHPEVLLCDDLASVLPLVQGREHVEISTEPARAAAFTKALKHCAPLATAGWSIYIERGEGQFKYGLFRTVNLPFSLSLSEGLAGASVGAVLATAMVDGVVELRGGSGASLLVHVSATRASAESAHNLVHRLVEEMVRDIDDSLVRDDVGQLLRRLLGRIARSGHGTLIAVAPKLPTGSKYKECVRLTPPLDLCPRVDAYHASKSGEALAGLVAAETLISGMLNSDGISLFDTKGRVLAYRMFTTPKRSGTAPGGARKRTYLALVDDVGSKLNAAFFLSQDGECQCHRSADVGKD